MSHGLTVPQGWTRGTGLVQLQTMAPVIALAQKFRMPVPSPGDFPSVGIDDVGTIIFDSKADADVFLDWWFDGRENWNVA